MRKPISTLIHSFKYKHAKFIGPLLARLMFYSGSFPQTEVVSFIPLHKKRQSERGYNQAQELATQLSVLGQLPCQSLLQRVKMTQTQASVKDRQTRLISLADCFKPLPNLSHLPRSVLLIDDVVTTGSTLNACAKVLKEMGVQEVHALCVAHGG